jgi:uncharacterized protein YjiS (DUF1127 family)
MESDMKVIPFAPAMDYDTRVASRAVRRKTLASASRAALSRILATLSEWRRRSRDRTHLAMLDDRMLRDIGVNRADLWREINKPFWRK